MQMHNPAQGVAPQLQHHVHLISLHRFPFVGTLVLEQAYRYLSDAPAIVKQIAPMAWHYVTAPRDGTIWLEWIPQDRLDQPFPSDGYTWADAEQTYRQEFHGYTVESKAHGIGYRAGQDNIAQHARTRYHFIAKNPSINAAHPDPSLWIVHYHQADQSRMIPISQLPLLPRMQQVLQQRRWLESQGQLERRDFMLHDREHWPMLNLPTPAQMQQPAMYGMNPMSAAQNRYPQPAMPQQAAMHPSKRPRTQAPLTMPGAPDGMPDTTIEDEENTALGDFFDHLTQRDISLARYTQHHRWMEEVFSSPYATNQIVPADLGLGLMGELKGLTDGILDPPSVDLVDRPDDRPLKAIEAQPFTNVKKDQVDEFSRRVEKHLEEGRAEIERMKAEHAAKMQDWKKVKALTQAEKRLRYATWKDQNDADVVFRFEPPSKNVPMEGKKGDESVEDIVKEVEDMLKVKIKSHEDSTRVARGGLRESKTPQFGHGQQASAQNGEADEMSSLSQPQQQAAETSANDGESQPDQAMAGGSTMPLSSTGFNQNQSSTEGQDGPAAANSSNTPEGDLNNLPDLDMMDDMDMDVDTANLNFDDIPNNDLTDQQRNATPSQTAGAQASGSGSNEVPNSTTANLTDPAAQTATAVTSSQTNQSADAGANPAMITRGVGLNDDALDDDAADSNMFNDAFDNLDNLDGADSGLVDFEGGDLGMEDSAFGDALHGMETPGETGGGTDTPTAGES